MEREHINLKQDRVKLSQIHPSLLCPHCGKQVEMKLIETALGLTSTNMIFAHHTADLYFICPECFSLMTVDDGKLCDNYLLNQEEHEAGIQEHLRVLYQLPVDSLNFIEE